MSTSLWTKAESFEPRGIASPGASFTRGLEGLLERFLQRMRERRTYADLARLDDGTLKDIGLDRGMLLGIAHQASLKRPRAKPVWAASRRWLRIREHGGRLLSGLIKLVFEARQRAALRDLRRFEASLGPNQFKEFGQRIADLPIHRPD